MIGTNCDVGLTAGLRNDQLDTSTRTVVERVFNRDPVRHFLAYVAVTWAVMPPRAEKLPTTVMRLGAHAPTRSSRI